MIWLDGIQIPTVSPVLPEIRDNIERFIPQDFQEFYRSGMTAGFLDKYPYWPIKLYSFFRPVGASNFGVAHYLITDELLRAIRMRAVTAQGYQSLLFRSDDAMGNSVQTRLFTLPARPICCVNNSGVYLLTLVDERYFWWDIAATVTIDSLTTWASLIAAIGVLIGKTIEVDPIPAAYLQPDAGLKAYKFVPELLDAIADSIGMRVIRTLDGRIRMISTLTSRNAITQNLRRWNRLVAGGEYAFNNNNPPNDLSARVPTQVKVVFNKANTADTEPWIETVSLASLVLPEFFRVQGHSPAKMFYSSELADWTGDPVAPNNAGFITALTQQIATDYYRWKIPAFDVSLGGAIPWDGEAHNTLIEHVHDQQNDAFYTRLFGDGGSATRLFSRGVGGSLVRNAGVCITGGRDDEADTLCFDMPGDRVCDGDSADLDLTGGRVTCIDTDCCNCCIPTRLYATVLNGPGYTSSLDYNGTNWLTSYVVGGSTFEITLACTMGEITVAVVLDGLSQDFTIDQDLSRCSPFYLSGSGPGFSLVISTCGVMRRVE